MTLMLGFPQIMQRRGGTWNLRGWVGVFYGPATAGVGGSMLGFRVFNRVRVMENT